jgi:hypothetical protein
MRDKLATAIIALMVGAGVALGVRAASASTPSSPTNRGPGGPTIIAVLKNSTVRALDLSPKGPSQGDMRIIMGPLFDPSGTRRIGRADLFCTVTDPGTESGSNLPQTECMETFSLLKGMITAQGVHARRALSAHALPFVDAVTGGTGTYKGARGELRGTTLGNATTLTFSLIRP